MAAAAAAAAPPLWELTPVQARESGRALKAMYGQGPEMTSVADYEIDAKDGGHFGIRVLKPSSAPNGVIVYFHGGGWVVGAIDEFDTLARELATRSRCAVVLVDYRKAPEHPFPTPVDDAWTALGWTADNLSQIAGREVPLVVAGDSAGGNLSAVVALRARDRGGPAIALQVLVYPATDSDLDRSSYVEPEAQQLLTRQAMVWFWDHYLPDQASRCHPDASPLRAESVADLPPAVVLTAQHDPLRDEGEAYARRLRDSGVPVEHRRFVDQMHGFFTFVNVLPGSDVGLDYVAAAIRQTINGVST
jgi:acetyl esterase